MPRHRSIFIAIYGMSVIQVMTSNDAIVISNHIETKVIVDRITWYGIVPLVALLRSCVMVLLLNEYIIATVATIKPKSAANTSINLLNTEYIISFDTTKETGEITIHTIEAINILLHS